MVVLENNDFGRPVGELTLDLDALTLGELPENLAIVPAYNVDTGEVLAWSVVPITSVATERTGP